MLVFSISNLSFTGFGYKLLHQLPQNFGLEIFFEFGDEFSWGKMLQEIYQEKTDWRLSIHGPCVAVNLADADDCRYMDKYEQVFKFAAKWSADFVVVHTNERIIDDRGTSKKRVEDRLKQLIRLAGKFNVQLLVENVGLKEEDTMLFDQDDYRKLLLALPEAGALIDTGHAWINGWDIPQLISCLGKRIQAYHIHDNCGEFDSHLPVGKGSIDWQTVFHSIRTQSPEATLIFEFANTGLAETLANIDEVHARYLNIDP
jgi:sugar phosphate isomerase/epimerase